MNNKYLNITDGGFNHIKSYYHEFSKPYIEYNKEDNKIYYEQPLDTNYDYVEIGGIKWATKCIGATSPYTYDAWFFQWGETQGHIELHSSSVDYDYNWANCPFNDNNDEYSAESWANYSGSVLDENGCLISKYDAATQMMGKNWKMPTKDELTVLANHKLTLFKTIVKGVDGTEITIESVAGVGTVNGVRGMCFGKTTESTNNVLFIPFRGGVVNKSIFDIGSASYVWTKSLDKENPIRSYTFAVNYKGEICHQRNEHYIGRYIIGVVKE